MDFLSNFSIISSTSITSVHHPIPLPQFSVLASTSTHREFDRLAKWKWSPFTVISPYTFVGSRFIKLCLNIILGCRASLASVFLFLVGWALSSIFDSFAILITVPIQCIHGFPNTLPHPRLTILNKEPDEIQDKIVQVSTISCCGVRCIFIDPLLQRFLHSHLFVETEILYWIFNFLGVKWSLPASLRGGWLFGIVRQGWLLFATVVLALTPKLWFRSSALKSPYENLRVR